MLRKSVRPLVQPAVGIVDVSASLMLLGGYVPKSQAVITARIADVSASLVLLGGVRPQIPVSSP
jgi:hypothetical protein